MKFLLLMSSLFYVSIFGQEEHCPLKTSLEDVYHYLIPVHKIQTIVEDHFKNDEGFRAAMGYFKSYEWNVFIQTLRQQSKWITFEEYLLKNGINLKQMYNAFIGVITSSEYDLVANADKASLRSIINDLKSVIPDKKIVQEIKEKIQNSTDSFAQIYRKLASKEFQTMVEDVLSLPEIKRIMTVFKYWGVDTDDLIKQSYEFFDWKYTRKIVKRSLKSDLDEFNALIPIEKLKKIAEEHLKTDSDLVELVTYFKGPKWKEIVDAIAARPEYQDLKIYLKSNGIDLDQFLNSMTVLVGKVQVGNESKTGTGKSETVKASDVEKKKGTLHPYGNLRSFLDDVEKEIPMARMLQLLNEKIEHSKEFQEFYAKLSSPAVHKMVDEIRELPSVVDFVQLLEKMGARVNQFLIVTYAFLGWGSPFPKDVVPKL